MAFTLLPVSSELSGAYFPLESVANWISGDKRHHQKWKARTVKLQHKTVLITGGTSGIGFELARQLGHKGNTVIVTGRDQARLDFDRRHTGDRYQSERPGADDPAVPAAFENPQQRADRQRHVRFGFRAVSGLAGLLRDQGRTAFIHAIAPRAT
jgi:NAD(P)-dependent dehydrogenase (short-subunit alcohol dehydrogenase family)